jgi:hypothetical protein
MSLTHQRRRLPHQRRRLLPLLPSYYNSSQYTRHLTSIYLQMTDAAKNQLWGGTRLSGFHIIDGLRVEALGPLDIAWLRQEDSIHVVQSCTAAAEHIKTIIAQPMNADMSETRVINGRRLIRNLRQKRDQLREAAIRSDLAASTRYTVAEREEGDQNLLQFRAEAVELIKDSIQRWGWGAAPGVAPFDGTEE